MIQHVELSGSRTGMDTGDRGSTAELNWAVWGSTSLDACRAYLTSVVPMYYDGLVYKSLSWEHLGGGNWEFRASYIHPDKADEEPPLDVGSYSFSFDTSGGTVKRMVSLATTSYPKAGETATDHNSTIGVVDGVVEGVDIGIPALKFSIRKRLPRAVLTMAYVKLLSDSSHTTNDATFLGFPAGELLFIGATGQEATDSDPEVTYNFVASPNATGLTVGQITGVDKKGHEYLWVDFELDEDASAKTTAKRARAAYVEQVYEESDYGKLEIL